MYYFIVNPSSRSGRGAKVWKTAETILELERIEYRVYFTSYQGHAVELAKEITARDGRLTLVAVGGDGTVNEVLNGIRDFSRVTFGYIPTGSSNDFARELGLPTDTVDAVQNLLHPAKFRRIDLGVTDLGGQKRYFAVSCGCGFDAAVCHEALASRMKNLLNRFHLGKLTYFGIALKQLLLCRPAPVTVTLANGKRLRFPKTYFAAAMNCRYEGGGLKMAPKARIHDGLLDVFVVEGLPRLLIMTMLPTAFLGLHTIFPGIHLYRARSVAFACPERLPVHMDGEAAFLEDRMEIRCLPDALSVIAAAG